MKEVNPTAASSIRKEPQSYYQRFLTYLMEIFPMQQLNLPLTDYSSATASTIFPTSSPSNSSMPARPAIGSLAQVVHSIRRVAELSGLHTYKKGVIEAEDFTSHSYHDVSLGSSNNPFVFPVKEYAPFVFKSLRDLSGVETKDFIVSNA